MSFAYLYCYEKPLWGFFCNLVWFWSNPMDASAVRAVFLWTDSLRMPLFRCPLVTHWHRAAAPSSWTALSGTPFLHVEVKNRDFCTLLTYSCCTEFIKGQDLCLSCSREQLQPACNLLLHSTLGLCNSLKGAGKNGIDFLGSHSADCTWLLGWLMFNTYPGCY